MCNMISKFLKSLFCTILICLILTSVLFAGQNEAKIVNYNNIEESQIHQRVLISNKGVYSIPGHVLSKPIP